MINKAFYMTGIEKLEQGEAPMPSVKPDGVIIKLKAVGICGSDLHYYTHGRIGDCIVEPPFILGHECAGEVVEVGSEVNNLKVGDRVCMEPGVPCYKCDLCLEGKYNLCRSLHFWATPPDQGCLCEYVAHPAAFTFKIPDNMSYVEGALVEPLAVGLHACNRANVRMGDTVAIIGAGCIGLVTLMSAKSMGATKIIVGDVNEKRLEKAAELGAITVNTEKEDYVKKVMELTGGHGADIVIDCAGFTPTFKQAVDAIKYGGVIVMVGLGGEKLDDLDNNLLSVKELDVRWVFRYRNVYPMAINAVSSGIINLKSIVSHSFKFEETDVAYATCTKDIRNVVKGVIEY